MKKNITKLLMAATLGAGALTMQGCTDTDVALGAGVVAGVIIGSALDSDHHHHRTPPRRYKPRRHHWSATTQTISPESVDVAQKYNISLEASSKLVGVLTAAQAGDVAALKELGLNKKDLVSLYNGRMISDESVAIVSENLVLDRLQTERVIKQIADEVKAQRVPSGGASENMYERFL